MNIYHALGLHMHQPPDNLDLLINSNEWEAQQIIKCYERAARYALMYKDVGKFHVGFSGILLEQFLDKEIQKKYSKFVDIPKMLDLYREAKNIEILGMGYYHPVFPLIPQDDWKEQIIRGRDIIKEVFGRSPSGFWPPEMGFCMEMIPYLTEAGYKYVVVDSVHILPLQENGPFPDSFSPYWAKYKSSQIVIIPRNRDISNAQESGTDPAWFINEVEHKISSYPKSARLVTTWSDGENGGWFRQMDEGSGFWGHFYAPLLEMVRNKSTRIIPVKISEFIKDNPPKIEVLVRTGAWNIGSRDGYDFSQWAGSPKQKEAIENLFRISKIYWDIKDKSKKLTKEKKKKLESAYQYILNAETSCYLFWGESWVPKIYDKLNKAEELLKEVNK